MIIAKGMLEILEMANSREPKTFNDFTKISISGRKVSSATVSKRLSELTSFSAIEHIVHISKAGRRVVAYRTTEKGKKILNLGTTLEKLVLSKR